MLNKWSSQQANIGNSLPTGLWTCNKKNRSWFSLNVPYFNKCHHHLSHCESQKPRLTRTLVSLVSRHSISSNKCLLPKYTWDLPSASILVPTSLISPVLFQDPSNLFISSTLAPLELILYRVTKVTVFRYKSTQVQVITSEVCRHCHTVFWVYELLYRSVRRVGIFPFKNYLLSYAHRILFIFSFYWSFVPSNLQIETFTCYRKFSYFIFKYFFSPFHQLSLIWLHYVSASL